MVTMKDIAELSGVSISTVSRVLNKTGKISPETTRKVLSSAAELMFKKGAVSQNFTEKTSRIALIVPGIGEFYHDDPESSFDIRSIRNSLEGLGHSVFMAFFNSEADFEGVELVKSLKKQMVDGVILSDPPVDSPITKTIQAAGLPVIQVNGISDSCCIKQIDYNNIEGMGKLVQAVLNAGHRDIALLTGPTTRTVTHNRLAGFKTAVADSGLEINTTILAGDFSLDSGYRNTLQLLSSGPKVTAIIAFSDYIALGALRAIREKGLSVPKDIAVTGFDDIEMALYADPPLTTVRRYSDGFAPFVVETLIRLIETNSDIDKLTVLFKTSLVVRKSL